MQRTAKKALDPFSRRRQRTSKTAADELPQKAREDAKRKRAIRRQAVVSSANGSVQWGRADDSRLQKRQFAASVATLVRPFTSAMRLRLNSQPCFNSVPKPYHGPVKGNLRRRNHEKQKRGEDDRKAIESSSKKQDEGRSETENRVEMKVAKQDGAPRIDARSSTSI
ncbi:hypothetical protein [Stieleria neptunia]|uniref:hypothetical protein n=1 Tax=Stieleria neptunia TaxID=2527979 RepID=UPI0011AA9606|nr:hypothetical protein [Stieleria neptunia]